MRKYRPTSLWRRAKLWPGASCGSSGCTKASVASSRSYTVTDTSDQVLVFTVDASSSDDAVRRASAVAEAFLQFRADYLKNEQQLQATILEQEITQARQQVDSINQQISQVSAQPTSSTQQAKLSSLRAQLTTASNALILTQQSMTVSWRRSRR